MRDITGHRKERVKNRNDKRYLAIQERLDRAIGKFLKLGRISRLNIPDVSDEAEVWRSTFYDHYIHMDEAIDRFYHKMEPQLRELEQDIEQNAKNLNPVSGKYNLEIVFSKILYFVYKNHEYYDVIVCRKNPIALTKISEIFRSILTQNWSNYGLETTDKCFTVLAWEISGVIFYWGEYENFDFDRIEPNAKLLARLSQNATKRLS